MRTNALTSPAGPLEAWLAPGIDAQDVLRTLEAAARTHDGRGWPSMPVAKEVELAGRRAWLKAGPLRGAARLRHGLRRVFGAPPPRLREAANHAWMIARVFQAPTPLAAGVLGGTAPRAQFLISAYVNGKPAGERLRTASVAERDALLRELALEVARLHALHFVHRDLHWRNLWWSEARSGRHLWFLDAWRGGERWQLRGPAYDLACLFLEGPSFLGEDECRTWLARYLEERKALGKPADAARLFARAGRDRRRLLDQLQREPGRWRAREAPVQSFDFAPANLAGSRPALP